MGSVWVPLCCRGGRPVAFLCRKFTDAERNYGVGEQELLAVVHAMRTWRCYLEGVNADMFTVVTDHNPLTYLQTQNTLSRRQVRWSEYLQMFTYKWLYRPGKSNIADPLSRNPAVVASMLPIVDGQALCNSLMCQEDHQQMTFKWAQSVGGPKLSESMPDELMASCAAVTRSKVLLLKCLQLSMLRVMFTPRNLPLTMCRAPVNHLDLCCLIFSGAVLLHITRILHALMFLTINCTLSVMASGGMVTNLSFLMLML